MVTENADAREIVDACYQIHVETGPGLLESAYEEILSWELAQRGLTFVRQHPLPVIYRGVKLEAGFRADLVVENRVVVEIKSLEALAPVHYKQVLTYLRMGGYRPGLLVNFGEDLIKNGIHRIANGMP